MESHKWVFFFPKWNSHVNFFFRFPVSPLATYFASRVFCGRLSFLDTSLKTKWQYEYAVLCCLQLLVTSLGNLCNLLWLIRDFGFLNYLLLKNASFNRHSDPYEISSILNRSPLEVHDWCISWSLDWSCANLLSKVSRLRQNKLRGTKFIDFEIMLL